MATLVEDGADAPRPPRSRNSLRTRCNVCTLRKAVEAFPSDEESEERILVTCSDCLGRESAGEHRIVVVHGSQQMSLRWPVDHDLRPPQHTAHASPQEALPGTKRKRAGKDHELVQKRLKQDEASPLAEKPDLSMCRICAEHKEETAFPTMPTLAWINGVLVWSVFDGDVPLLCALHLSADKNNRFGGICEMCIGQWLRASIECKGAEGIGCPHESCRNAWHPTKHIGRYLDHEEFEAYSQQLFSIWVKTNRNLKPCFQPSCRAVGLMDTETAGYPHFECYQCKTRQCANCGVEWHRGQTCQEYRFLNVADAKSEEETQALRSLVRQGAKRCPHCSLAVVKDGGCLQMWCPNCSRSFSWDSAERIRSAPITRIMTRARKRAQEAQAAVPQPLFPNQPAECEIDDLERVG